MIVKDEIYIPFFDTKRTLHIYLPDVVDENKQLSVIYMFDGHNLFFDEDATYGKSWGFKQYLDEKQANVVIVGLECNHLGNKRLCEFSPYSFEDDILGSVIASGKQLTTWIVKQLKPWIEKKYSISSNKENTIVAGSSMGGLMALYAGSMHTKTFGKAICISPFYDHVYDFLYQDIIKSNTLSKSAFYLSWGYKEYASMQSFIEANENNLAITRLLSSKKAQVYPHCYQEGEHTEASWEKEIPIFMEELKIV